MFQTINKYQYMQVLGRNVVWTRTRTTNRSVSCRISLHIFLLIYISFIITCPILRILYFILISYFNSLEGVKFNVINQTSEHVEISFSRAWKISQRGSLVPLNVDKRYVNIYICINFVILRNYFWRLSFIIKITIFKDISFEEGYLEYTCTLC